MLPTKKIIIIKSQYRNSFTIKQVCSWNKIFLFIKLNSLCLKTDKTSLIFTQSWKKSFTKILSLLSKMQFDWRCECYVVDKNILREFSLSFGRVVGYVQFYILKLFHWSLSQDARGLTDMPITKLISQR